MNREMFKPYDLLKESKMLQLNTVYSKITKMLSLMDNSPGPQLLDIRVDIWHSHWTDVSMSSHPTNHSKKDGGHVDFTVTIELAIYWNANSGGIEALLCR